MLTCVVGLMACNIKKPSHTHNYVNEICSCGEEKPSSYSAGLIFQLNSNGTEYSVIDYTGSDTNIIIPSMYNKKPVNLLRGRK